MSRKCLVPDCRPQPGEFLTYHRIPVDDYKRQIWLDQLDLPSTSTGRVCSKHFLSSDYVLKSNGRHLKPCSYPQCIKNDNVELIYDDEAGDEMNIQDDICVASMCDENAFDASASDGDVSMMCVNQSISKEHSYAKRIDTVSEGNAYARRTIANLRKIVAKQKKTAAKLRKELKSVEKRYDTEHEKFANFDKLSPFVQEFIKVLMKHYKQGSSPKVYSPLLRKFALTLHYHSPDAYRFVRFSFGNCLPHAQTIVDWYRVVDGSPGFTNESLYAIAELQKRTPYPIVVSIVVDGMALRKHIQKMGNEVIGYINFGGVIPELKDRPELAKEALIFLAVGVNVAFKIPIGYFLINGLTGKQLSYLAETGISLLLSCKVIVGTLTFDGLKANFTMVTELGCFLNDVKNLITSFDDIENIDGNNSEMEDDIEINIGQLEEISKKYFNFIKKKDKGGLYYPSDSLYRVVLLAERTFKTALKESGGKMLHRRFSLARMVFTVHQLYHKYSDVIFSELNDHFLLEASHMHALIENIARFYLKTRINFLTKTVSANNGRSQKYLHLTHFKGM